MREAMTQQSVVQQALDRGDCQAVRRAVHRLRGQAMMFDAVELCGLLAKIEEQALTANLAPCAAFWSEAMRELETVREELGSINDGCRGLRTGNT